MRSWIKCSRCLDLLPTSPICPAKWVLFHFWDWRHGHDYGGWDVVFLRDSGLPSCALWKKKKKKRQQAWIKPRSNYFRSRFCKIPRDQYEMWFVKCHQLVCWQRVMLEGWTRDSLLISRAADRGGGGVGAQSLSHHPHADRSLVKSTRHFLEPHWNAKKQSGGKKNK